MMENDGNLGRIEQYEKCRSAKNKKVYKRFLHEKKFELKKRFGRQCSIEKLFTNRWNNKKWCWRGTKRSIEEIKKVGQQNYW